MAEKHLDKSLNLLDLALIQCLAQGQQHILNRTETAFHCDISESVNKSLLALVPVPDFHEEIFLSTGYEISNPSVRHQTRLSSDILPGVPLSTLWRFVQSPTVLLHSQLPLLSGSIHQYSLGSSHSLHFIKVVARPIGNFKGLWIDINQF